MASLATVTFLSSRPVRIDWGDGTVVVAATSPASHLYAVAGNQTVTLTDTVNGLSSPATTVDCGTFTWNDAATRYSTWDALAAANPNWDGVLNG